MQQTQPNVIQRLNEEFTNRIISTPFPVERLTQRWKQSALRALEFASPYSLQVSAEQFKKLAELVPGSTDFSLSLFEFATLSNNLEARSPRDLGIPLSFYVVLMMEAAEQVKYYQEKVQEIRKAAEKKIADDDASLKTAERGGMKPVKAEA